VTSNDNAGQQIQPYLPGMGSGSRIARAAKTAGFKEPHQMSPDEFAAHPYAVFSSSHVDPEKFWTQPRFGGTDVLHFGTEQSALERHRATSTQPPREGRARTKDARMHVFWHVPESEDLSVGVDNTANDFEPGTRYYQNAVEDTGSLSMASNESEKFKRQGDYVREAIAAGRGHEIPAITRGMYEQGLLDRGTYLPISHTMKYVRPVGVQSIALPLGSPDDIPEGFPNGWGKRVISPRPFKVSDNGPSLERIKNQVRKDAKSAKRS